MLAFEASPKLFPSGRTPSSFFSKHIVFPRRSKEKAWIVRGVIVNRIGSEIRSCLCGRYAVTSQETLIKLDKLHAVIGGELMASEHCTQKYNLELNVVSSYNHLHTSKNCLSAVRF